MKGKIYKIVRYFGDVWLVKECNTDNFYILDRNEKYFFLILKKSMQTNFVLSDLTKEDFTEVSEMSHKRHTFKLLKCKETKCLYVADVVPETQEIKHLSRVPCSKADLILNPQNGNIISVFHDDLDIVHIEKGKFVT